MSLGRERHYFAGGNTTAGFTDFFQDIISKDEEEIYIIKGAPGTGKSRMMKNIARAAVLEGYDVEVIKCSGDPESYDGVRVTELRKTILDGTAPHVFDMNAPGIRDRIINLGDFWNEDILKVHKKEISALAARKSANYARAYKYLKAAREIQDNIDSAADKAVCKGKLNQFIQNLNENFFRDIDVAHSIGSEKRMFGTAITARGSQKTLDTLFRGYKVYALKCSLGRASCDVVEALQTEAVKRGFYVESLRCPFAPKRTEHIVIPQLALVFTTYNKYHSEMDCDVFGEYLLDVYYNDLLMQPEDMEYDAFRVEELIEKAQHYLEKAQNIHKEIECFYISSMDFQAINQCTENVIDSILKN